jgi:hypothetical protein
MKTFLAAAAVLAFGGISNLFGQAAAAQVRDRNPFGEDDITFQEVDLIPRTWVAVILPFDSDGDGIPNLNEIMSVCLNAYDPDTDDDGIPDGVETSGIINGFDFNAEGANPCRRDIFVELDAEQRTVGMVVEDAQFGQALQQALIDFYAWLPIANPDGSTGITLHLYPSDVLAANFDCATQDSPFSYPSDYFHKAELCLNSGGGVSGNGAYPGQRFRINGPAVNGNPADDSTEGAQYSWYWLFLHELGHNLHLLHGGNVNANWKPHYPSLMNYLYDQSINGSVQTLAGAGVSYSTGALAAFPLDECALTERGAFPGLTVADVAFMTFPPASFGVINGSAVNGPRVDWSGSGAIDFGAIAFDVTGDGVVSCTQMFDVDDLAIIASDMGLGLPGRP